MKFSPTLEQIIKINKKYGGHPLDKGNIEFALSSGKNKTDLQKLTLLWRAILTGHPFSDANKRTASDLTIDYARANNFEIDKESMVWEIVNIAKENITDLYKIRRRIQYVAKPKRQGMVRKSA
jgi:prophage maintenance system killer protein